MIIGFRESKSKAFFIPESSEEEFIVAYLLAVFRNGGTLTIEPDGIRGSISDVRPMTGPQTKMGKAIDQYISCIK